MATMRVDDILALTSFGNSHVLAGEGGLGQSVDRLFVLEITDILTDVAPGSMVLSTLYPILNNEAQVENVVARFVEMGVVALAIKLNRQGDRVPDAILAEGDRLGFPIILLESGGNFSLQVNDFLQCQLEKNLSELRQRDQVHGLLLEMMSRGQQYPDLQASLAELLGYTTFLYDAHFNLLAGSEPLDKGKIVSEIKAYFQTYQDQRFLQVTEGGEDVWVYGVWSDIEMIGYILVTVPQGHELTPMERMTMEQFGTAYTIIYHRQQALGEVERRYHEELLFDLVVGKFVQASDAAARANRLHWSLEYPALLIALAMDTKDRRRLQRQQKNIQTQLRTRYKDSQDLLLLGGYGDQVLALVSAPPSAEPDKVVAILREACGWAGIEHYALGVSRPVADVFAFPQAYEEAVFALKVSGELRPQAVTYYDELGLFRILHTTGNRAETESYCQEILGDLLRYDEVNGTELYKTLQSIVAAEGNLKAAAAAMFIHYNTIRYRFKKIEELLGRKLTGMTAYQDVYIAMQILEMFGRPEHE